MIFSVAVILLVGLILGGICKIIKFPALFGMIIGGIIIGPYALNFIDPSLLSISSDIRKIALVIILIRAGLKLSVDDLKKVGRPAILMCFLPATCELVGMMLLAPRLLGMSPLDAAILGTVIGAVSPAVIVPSMIKIIDEGYGTGKAIPQMILAGASVDDVFVIVLFTTCTSLALGNGINVMSFVNIPVSIVVGILVGLACGFCLFVLFDKINIHLVIKVLIVLAVCLMIVVVEDKFPVVPFASLIAVMSLGLMIRQKSIDMAKELSAQYDKLWVVAEIFLFVLVGASVAIDSAKEAGISAVILLAGVLLFRMAGVWLCLIATKLNNREKMFCMLAYTPKATVQAAIGGLPLAYGLACGNIVLTVSVIAILVTAPLGAFAIDLTYKKFLEK